MHAGILGCHVISVKLSLSVSSELYRNPSQEEDKGVNQRIETIREAGSLNTAVLSKEHLSQTAFTSSDECFLMDKIIEKKELYDLFYA